MQSGKSEIVILRVEKIFLGVLVNIFERSNWHVLCVIESQNLSQHEKMDEIQKYYEKFNYRQISNISNIPKSQISTDIALMRAEVTIHNKLMGSCNLLQIVVMVELLRDVCSEVEACPSEGSGPSCLFVWVGPEQITHWAVGGHLLDSIQGSDVVKFVDHWRETAVQTENRAVWN